MDLEVPGSIPGSGTILPTSAQITTHVLLNNGQLGKIPKEQRAGERSVWETSLHNPSFAAYAKSCGSKGFNVKKAEDNESALAEAIARCRPALVEILTDAELV